MQKINILGVELTDYSLKESLLRLDGYVRGRAQHHFIHYNARAYYGGGK